MTTPVIPAHLLKRWTSILPAHALACAVDAIASSASTPTAIRLNPLRADPRETLFALRAGGITLHEVSWFDLAFTTSLPPRQLQAHPAHGDGAFHIQSLSSMIPALLLNPQPGDAVLDLCAAPGSKTSQLAAMMNNKGQLIAVDSSRPRYYRLREVLRVLGAQADCICAHGERWGRGHPAQFDRILVDVPCSGEGRIHTGDDAALEDWSIAKVRRLASLQKALLHSAIDALRPGGTLVYSTCTFAPEENELVLQRALERYPDRIEIIPMTHALAPSCPALVVWMGDQLHPSIAEARRILPPLEGFFVAVLRKLR
ncbi:MAG: RsmB/NOP family class I SAM-dependent RNA methyltransferase [Phycisphaerales bacterium]|nr:RsmB/NOP family class I SAM-dependent RNA methyltransferase [Phycisphaerales bacterium]